MTHRNYGLHIPRDVPTSITRGWTIYRYAVLITGIAVWAYLIAPGIWELMK